MNLKVTPRELASILAGLRVLQTEAVLSLPATQREAVNAIANDAGPGLDAEEIDQLIAKANRVQVTRKPRPARVPQKAASALRQCCHALGMVLDPLDDEERRQPVFRACSRARSSAIRVLCAHNSTHSRLAPVRA